MGATASQLGQEDPLLRARREYVANSGGQSAAASVPTEQLEAPYLTFETDRATQHYVTTGSLPRGPMPAPVAAAPAAAAAPAPAQQQQQMPPPPPPPPAEDPMVGFLERDRRYREYSAEMLEREAFEESAAAADVARAARDLEARVPDVGPLFAGLCSSEERAAADCVVDQGHGACGAILQALEGCVREAVRA